MLRKRGKAEELSFFFLLQEKETERRTRVRLFIAAITYLITGTDPSFGRPTTFGEEDKVWRLSRN